MADTPQPVPRPLVQLSETVREISSSGAYVALEQPLELNRPDLDQQLGRGGDGQRYIVAELLGAGANGKVYALTDRNLARNLAIKVLQRRPVAGGYGTAGSDFITEARVTAALQHPAVPPVHDLDVTADGRLYFTTSRIEGRSLGEAIRGSTTSKSDPLIAETGRIVAIGAAVAGALAYAHSKQIIHQDVKPDNIMLGAFGEVLLVDWGCATSVSSGSRRIGVSGTPLYMSPEQARGEGADERSDVYCLGTTLLHALLLRAPLGGEGSPEKFWERKRHGEFDPPTASERQRIPAALLAIALKCVAHEPAARYANANALLADLQAFQNGLAVGAHRDPPWARLRRWYRANVLMTWTVSVAAVIVALVAGAWWLERAARRAEWRVVLDETFDDPLAARDRWEKRQVSWTRDQHLDWHDGGNFTIKDGSAFLSSDYYGPTDLLYRDTPLGDLRVEWTMRGLDMPENFNCFIGGNDRYSGYTLHMGSWGNPRWAALTRDGTSYHVIQGVFLPEALVVNRDYQFALELAEGRLRYWLDGGIIFDVQLPEDEAIAAGFGFDVLDGQRQRIDHVRILHRPPARLVSPLVAVDRLRSVGKHLEAAQLATEIARSYPGSDLAIEAAYRQAICILQGDRPGLALARLDGLLASHPNHHIAPYCALHLLRSARRRKDLGEIERLLQILSAWPGHPACRDALDDLATSFVTALTIDPDAPFGTSAFPADAPAQVRAGFTALTSLSQRLEVSWLHTPFAMTAAEILKRHGRFLDMLDLFPVQSNAYVDALLNLGRYQEVLTQYADRRDQYGEALLQLNQPALVLAGLYSADQRYHALVMLGRGDEILTAPWARSDQQNEWLVQQHRYAESLALIPEHEPGWRVEPLLKLGRDQEIHTLLQDLGPPSDFVLRILGRYRDLMRRFPREHVTLFLAAFDQLIAGHHDIGDLMLDGLEREQLNRGQSDLDVMCDVLPAVRRIINGAPVEATLADAQSRCSEGFGQRTRYLLGFLRDGDERIFRLQPSQRLLAERLAFTVALRADLRNEATAGGLWRAFLDLPLAKTAVGEPSLYFATWRFSVRAETQP